MENYFKRQIQLWGVEKQLSLREKSILIVGSGGLGSSLALALGSVGIGQITLVDFDEVEIHNIHRQIAFSLKDQGRSKAKVVKERIESRSHYTEVQSFEESFEEFSGRDLEFDLIFDGTDNLDTRNRIDEYAKKIGIPWVYGSVESFFGYVGFFEKAPFRTFQIMEKGVLGVAAPMVMQVASLQANIGLRYLVGEDTFKESLYTLSFENDGSFATKKFKMPVE
ncbi:dinucleotide-utilizing enzyme possibly involved in molybdopterin or thiamin biosynthesis [Thiovulum sp. ES]|nr:dinucleotide-utilizing enzyme possibly involved in molybdopterin or thiamin biosynthesis [Thiovulum sp. ES]